jgi:hypothetical protein
MKTEDEKGKMSKRMRPEPLHEDYTDPGRVREEIECIEARLAEIGHDGDCAYEKAMVRFFQQQVEIRRDWLDGGLEAAQG